MADRIPPAAPTPRRRRGSSIAGRFALYLAGSWIVLAALAGDLSPAAPWLVLVAAAYTTIPLIAFLAWRGWPFYPSATFRVLVVRPALYAQLLLPFVAGAGLLGALLGAPFGQALGSGRMLAGITLLVGSALLLAGYLGSRTLVVREIEAGVPGLPREFDGLRIVQISDLHIGPHTSKRFLRSVAQAIDAMAPDLIAVTGDLVDDRAEDVAHYAAALGTMVAPLGVFVIAGNHDVYSGWDAVQHGVERLTGGTVLVNDSHVIRRGAARLAIVGTGDPAGGSRWRDPAGRATRVAPDVERSFARVPPGATVIAFAHNPVLWPRLAERGVALPLSGHTHWGQLAIPRLGWSLASVFLERAMGTYRDGNALLYIHPGTGYWGIPFRLGALPEVAAITLRRTERADVSMGAARCAGRPAA